ncbi:hypothetical protein D9M72_119070 [compost metagenome]
MQGVTKYQIEILEAVKKHKDAGRHIDLDELLDSLSWAPTKQSLQFSIRALIAKRMICKVGTEVRRGRKRVCFDLDLEGVRVFDPRAGDPVPGLSDDLLSSVLEGV